MRNIDKVEVTEWRGDQYYRFKHDIVLKLVIVDFYTDAKSNLSVEADYIYSGWYNVSLMYHSKNKKLKYRVVEGSDYIDVKKAKSYKNYKDALSELERRIDDILNVYA